MSSASSARSLVAIFAILLHVAAAPVRASVAEAPDAVVVDHKKFVRDAVNMFLGPVSPLDIVRVFGNLPSFPSFEDALKPPATVAAPAGAPSADPALERSVTSFLSAIRHEMSSTAAAPTKNPKEEVDVVASRTASSFLSVIGHETSMLTPPPAAAAHENPKEEGDGVASRTAASFLSAIGHETSMLLPPPPAAAAHENPKEEGDVVAASARRRAQTSGIAMSAFVVAFGYFVF